MDAEGFNSAYKLALTIALLYVLWMVVGYAVNFSYLMANQTHESKEIIARQHNNVPNQPLLPPRSNESNQLITRQRKLTAAGLETLLKQNPRQFPANAQ